MLLVKTFLANAGEKGLGLFAAEPIDKGTLWWMADESFNKVISGKQFQSSAQLVKEFVYTYGFLLEDGRWYVCLDDARFVNHSDNPNTAPARKRVGALTSDWIATRDIPAGEEITSDYRQFCETCNEGLPFVNSERGNGQS